MWIVGIGVGGHWSHAKISVPVLALEKLIKFQYRGACVILEYGTVDANKSVIRDKR